jgi:hypothetical protein
MVRVPLERARHMAGPGAAGCRSGHRREAAPGGLPAPPTQSTEISQSAANTLQHSHVLFRTGLVPGADGEKTSDEALRMFVGGIVVEHRPDQRAGRDVVLDGEVPRDLQSPFGSMGVTTASNG